ncbi:MAG: hypothetical protein OEQ53_08305, partial [Saprospiraceae bacterium]|nr:hypothetical protein [Saprospiraceae bacterium]
MLFVRSSLTALMLLGGLPLFAHVKWFSKFSFEDQPLQLADMSNNIFWILLIASMIVIGFLTFADEKIEMSAWY